MYLIISIVLAMLALIFLLIPLCTGNRNNIKTFGSVALVCLLLCVGSVAGSFFTKPKIEKTGGYVEVVECIEEGSEPYALEVIWI